MRKSSAVVLRSGTTAVVTTRRLTAWPAGTEATITEPDAVAQHDEA